MTKYKLIVLNTDEKEFSYGGVCPFMRNMHPYLDKAFELSYITLPQSWKSFPGSTRVKYLLYLWLHKKRLKNADFILSHGPEGSYVASYSSAPYAHVYHGNSNPMSISRFRIGKYFAKMYDRMFERIEKTAALIYTVGPARNERHKKLFNPLDQNVKPLPTSKRRGFIFAGRLEAMKNVDRLIRIYAQLPEEVKRENPFYIAGYGTQEDALRNLAKEIGLLGNIGKEGKETVSSISSLSKENKKGQVKFLGKVDNTKMMEVDADKKILLMASSTEGMPTAIAEAFSVGVPVLSTAVGDIPSVVISNENEDEHDNKMSNGELLPLDFQDEEYVAAIMRVLANYDEYARNAYESSKPFNRETITKEVIDDINKFLENK